MKYRNLLLEADSRIKKIINDIIRPALPDLSDEEYKKLFYDFRHATGLMSNSDMVFIPNIAKILFWELDFGEQGVDNTTAVNFISDVIEYLKKTGNVEEIEYLFHYQDIVANYLSIIKKYNKEKRRKENEEKNKGNENDYTNQINPNYTIIDDIDYYEANKIGEYTGENGTGPLCYTQTKSTWNSYTNNGRNICYCLLRNDWETVPCEHTEQILLNNDNSPVYSDANAYDSYGLSVIFVFINPDGEIAYSNTRWNHKARTVGSDVDKAFRKSDLERILNVSFKSVFKPNNNATINYDYFSSKYIRYLIKTGKYDNNENFLIKNTYVDNLKIISTFSEGLKIFLEFLVNIDNNQILNKYDTKNIRQVQLFNNDNRLFFQYTNLNDSHFLIDTNGNIICENMYVYPRNSFNFCEVIIYNNDFSRLYSFMTRDLKVHDDIKFTSESTFRGDYFCNRTTDGDLKIFNKDGKCCLNNILFYDVNHDDFKVVFKDYSVNVFNTKTGQLMCNENFVDVVEIPSNNNFVLVKNKQQGNYALYSRGKILTDFIYQPNYIRCLDVNLFRLKTNDIFHIVNEKGENIAKNIYSFVSFCPIVGYFEVMYEDGHKNIINRNGDELLDEPVNNISHENGLNIIENKDGKQQIYNDDFKIKFYKSFIYIVSVGQPSNAIAFGVDEQNKEYFILDDDTIRECVRQENGTCSIGDIVEKAINYEENDIIQENLKLFNNLLDRMNYKGSRIIL